MLRTMVSQLIQHERIRTTVPKAKELRKLADKVVTYAKTDTPRSRDKIKLIVRGDLNVHKLMTLFKERYAERAGGYCRILRTHNRRGDNAEMALIEYIDRPGELKPPRPPRTFVSASQTAFEESFPQDK